MLNIKKIKVSADFEQISCLFGLEQSCCSRMHKWKNKQITHIHTHEFILGFYYFLLLFLIGTESN